VITLRIHPAGAALALLLISGSVQQPGVVDGVVTAPGFPATGAVVYLMRQGESGLAATTSEAALIDQANLRFVPRVLAIPPGTTVDFRNSDPMMHNVFSPAFSGDPFDLGTYPRTEHRSHSFDRTGVYVILCHVHPEMAAYVVVVETPHTAVVDENGRFRLDGVPPGRYLLRVWHRRIPRFEQAVIVPPDGLHRLEVDLGTAGRRGESRP